MAAAAFLVAVTSLFFSGLFAGRTYNEVSRVQAKAYPWGDPDAPVAVIHWDQAKSYYPWQVFLNGSLRDGDVPLWNPYAFTGVPFPAANNSNALYPPRVVLGLVLSATRVGDALAAAHMLLAGIAMYLLLLYFRVSVWGALLGAVAWMANSFMLAWLAVPHYGVVATFLPVALLLSDASIRRRSWPAALGLGVVAALMFLGGNLLFVAVCFAVLFVYGAALVITGAVEARRREGATPRSTEVAGDLARLAAPWLVAGGLSAFLLLPTLELTRATERSPLSYDQLREFGLPASELVRVFVAGPHRTFKFVAGEYNAALFSGTAVAALAIVGLAARRRGAWFARILGLLALLAALGTPAVALPYLLIPAFDNFKPLGRVLFLFAFALAILAAFGLDSVLAAVRRRVGGQRGAVLAAAIAVSVIGVTVAQLRVHAEDVVHDQEANPEALFPATPIVDRLRLDEGARFLSVDGVFPGSTSLVYPLRNAFGYESLLPGRVQDFWRVVAGLPVGDLSRPLHFAFEPAPSFDVLRTDLLPRAGVGYVVASPAGSGRPEPDADALARLEPVLQDRGARVFRVRDPLPRGYLVGACEQAEGSREALERFQQPGFDARGTVILERAQLEREGLTCDGGGRRVAGTVRTLAESNDELALAVNARAPGFLVLNESWDTGWRARVDGSDAPVLAANSAFRALPIGRGAHTVELEYRPRSYEVGAAISAATILVLLVASAVLGVRAARGRRATA